MRKTNDSCVFLQTLDFDDASDPDLQGGDDEPDYLKGRAKIQSELMLALFTLFIQKLDGLERLHIRRAREKHAYGTVHKDRLVHGC